MCINTSQASPAPGRYQISSIYYIEILLRRRSSLGSIYIHLSGAGEAFMHTLPAPEKCLYTLIWRRRGRRSEKPENYLYKPLLSIYERVWYVLRGASAWSSDMCSIRAVSGAPLSIVVDLKRHYRNIQNERMERKEGSGTYLWFWNALSQFMLHIHTKYTKVH